MTLQTYTRSRNRRLSGCYRHPSEPVTGFCASCLRERLASLDPSDDPEPSSSTSSLVASSLHTSGNGCGCGCAVGPDLDNCRSKRSTSFSSVIPELRRCRSVSAGKCEASSSSLDQRRKSCDVKLRNSLADLFDFDDDKSGLSEDSKVESKNLGFSRLADAVPELKEEEENEEENRVSVDACRSQLNIACKGEEEADEGLKTMKEFIDLELQSRKHNVRDLKDIAGSFWDAASVFTKKLRNWRQKQKMRSHRLDSNGGEGGGRDSNDLLAKRFRTPRRSRLRDTQSEVGEYAMGRRSCDTEPRFSVDAASVPTMADGPRISFDEPRASWDGYLIARTIPRLAPMLSVVENGILAPVNRFGSHRMSKEEQMGSINEDDIISCGSAQTNSDSSSSRRRSSSERSSSLKSSSKKTFGSEADEVNSLSDPKASPASADLFQGRKLVITEKELRDWHLNSGKVDCSESFEVSSKNDNCDVVGGKSRELRKSTRWLKMLGFMNKGNDKKYGNATEKITEHLVSEVPETQGRDADDVVGGDFTGMLVRSSSCVSSRNPRKINVSYQRTSSVAESGDSGEKSMKGFALERTQSSKNSLGNVDNGTPKFYLTPLRTFRRSKSGKSRLKNFDSGAGNVLQLN